MFRQLLNVLWDLVFSLSELTLVIALLAIVVIVLLVAITTFFRFLVEIVFGK